jgi:ATP-binding cassette subfamily G (WHITE) protein 2 (SNQ2)
MTVGQTIAFATAVKTPADAMRTRQSKQEWRTRMSDFLLRSMGIAHTKDTKLGNEYIRGVSGGERKRVSIIEVLATKASVFCWDNSTRGQSCLKGKACDELTLTTGLDASTALQWAQAVRTITDVLGLTSIITLYQAGNGIYDLMDDVLVLDLGKQIYYGPREQARPFMESLGFEYTPGANVGDMLTGVTVPKERVIRQGWESKFPRTAEEIRQAYLKSDIYQQMQTRMSYPETQVARDNTAAFIERTHHDRSRSLPKNSPMTVPFLEQTLALTRRQLGIIWGNKLQLGLRQGTTLVQALIGGSLFYNVPQTSTGLFLASGVVFFSVLYNSWVHERVNPSALRLPLTS